MCSGPRAVAFSSPELSFSKSVNSRAVWGPAGRNPLSRCVTCSDATPKKSASLRCVQPAAFRSRRISFGFHTFPRRSLSQIKSMSIFRFTTLSLYRYAAVAQRPPSRPPHQADGCSYPTPWNQISIFTQTVETESAVSQVPHTQSGQTWRDMLQPVSRPNNSALAL